MKHQSDFFIEIIVAMLLILTIVKIERERIELESRHAPVQFKIEQQLIPAACSITQVGRCMDLSVSSSIDL